jgi:hypothetical protein
MPWNDNLPAQTRGTLTARRNRAVDGLNFTRQLT